MASKRFPAVVYWLFYLANSPTYSFFYNYHLPHTPNTQQRKSAIQTFAFAANSIVSSEIEKSSLLTQDLQGVPIVAITAEEEDTRPHMLRIAAPRKARRMNNGFKHLYRHDSRISNSTKISPLEYLMDYGGYTKEKVLQMNATFPPLLELDVHRHLEPKMRFLKETMEAVDVVGDTTATTTTTKSSPINVTTMIHVLPEEVRQQIPPHYFGARLKRIAFRHAFLIHLQLPHGQTLLTTQTNTVVSSKEKNVRPRTLWQEFLFECRNTKRFAALCVRWNKEYIRPANNNNLIITSQQVEAFDVLFGRGLMAAARNELCQEEKNGGPLQYVNTTSGEITQLLIRHGANPLERDVRGISLLHWAAGAGNLDTVKVLLPYFVNGTYTEAERDAATPFHWAAAGANAREFGIGGHTELCSYLLSITSDRKGLVNALTKDGNSALMWAAWSGTLETVKLLVRNIADTTIANRNGCTVAHWAASGGNVEVCQYLASIVGVDFHVPNHGGNTPLHHAVAFGRVEVVNWFKEQQESSEADSSSAADLAWGIVDDWTNGEDERRQQILQLFEDWY